MRVSHGAYYHTGEVWTRLASLDDKATALRKWAEIEGQPPPSATGTVQAVWERYEIHPQGLGAVAPRTQKDYRKDAARILRVFGKMQIAAVKPEHVRRYLDERVDKHGKPARVRATREKALLSLLCTKAREWGIMHGANPCAGIKGWKAKRLRYVTDQENSQVAKAAPEAVQDVLTIALYTAQRPADVRKMLRTDIRDGALWVEQGKTKNRMGIALEGPLKAAVDRCLARAAAAKVSCLHIATNAEGQPWNEWTLRAHIRKAAKAAGVTDYQMRDMRSKAATDLEDLGRAQGLLGHKTRAMTEEYVKGRRGEVVRPFEPKNKRQ
jgi:hypothetical protein